MNGESLISMIKNHLGIDSPTLDDISDEQLQAEIRRRDVVHRYVDFSLAMADHNNPAID